jgi:glycosyltransferase involved in cell wall biosynthesis
MHIQIVTDAWSPQVNGVVRTLQSVIAELETLGHTVGVISPDLFRSLPCPTYSEIRLALATSASVGRLLDRADPDAIHIATEGPLGVAARSWCLRRGLPFTTAYHTQFPDYLAKRTHLPAALFWRYIRWFHAPSRAIMVSTPTVMRQLAAHGLPHSKRWSRGVDMRLFRPDMVRQCRFAGLAGPILLYVGRIAVEKNVEAFLRCSHPGNKILVGDGPDLISLKRRYPRASFLGALRGEALAGAYASADLLVFPSRTDTFGLVMIEALACGTPVAAYPVPGPVDVLDPSVGCMDADLDTAIAGALQRERAACAEYAQAFSWPKSAGQFLNALVPIKTVTAQEAA